MVLLQASMKAMANDDEPSCMQTLSLSDNNSSNIFGSEGDILMLEKLRLDDEIADDEFFSSTSSVGRNSDGAEQSLYIDDSTACNRYLYMENIDTDMKVGDCFGIELPVESSNYKLLEKEEDEEEEEEEIYDDDVFKTSNMGIFKDGGFYVVKDICIDESVFNEKIMVEDKDEIHKLADVSKIIDGRVDAEDPMLESIKSPIAKNGHSILVLEKDALEPFSLGDLGKRGCEIESGDCVRNDIPDEKVDLDQHFGQGKGDQKNLEEESPAPAATVSLSETCSENNEKEGPCIIESESDFNSIGTSALPRSFLPHSIRGDSSTSGPSFLCTPVASSGRLTFSDCISHRSDSSTTSACSFAFPILPSEWNSSPVKMAKADRRRLGRRRLWNLGLFCCKS